jgi:hypothetical protein
MMMDARILVVISQKKTSWQKNQLMPGSPESRYLLSKGEDFRKPGTGRLPQIETQQQRDPMPTLRSFWES